MAIKPGPELDSILAKGVLGWTLRPSRWSQSEDWLDERGYGTGYNTYHKPFRPSVNTDDALRVLYHVCNQGWDAEIVVSVWKDVVVTLRRHGNLAADDDESIKQYSAHASDVCEAICRAALGPGYREEGE